MLNPQKAAQSGSQQDRGATQVGDTGVKQRGRKVHKGAFCNLRRKSQEDVLCTQGIWESRSKPPRQTAMQQGQRASAAGSRWPGSEGDSGKSLVVPAQQYGCHGRWPAMPPADDRAGRCPIPLTPLPQKPLWSPGKSSEDHVLKENAVLF